MDDLEAVARLGAAQLRALVMPRRQCRHCRVELEARPGPIRPLVWCEAHRTAIGRRPAGPPARRTICPDPVQASAGGLERMWSEVLDV